MLTPIQTQVARVADLNAALEPTPLPKPLADIVVSYTSDIFDRCMPTLNYFLNFSSEKYVSCEEFDVALSNARILYNDLCQPTCEELRKSNEEPIISERFELHNKIAAFVIIELSLENIGRSNRSYLSNDGISFKTYEGHGIKHFASRFNSIKRCISTTMDEVAYLRYRQEIIDSFANPPSLNNVVTLRLLIDKDGEEFLSLDTRSLRP